MYERPGSRTLESILGTTTGGPGGRRRGDPGHTVENYRLFEDLLSLLLEYDPKKRITPLDVLKHPFINNKPATTSSSA